MEKDYGLKRDRSLLNVVVEKICSEGFASYVKRIVKDLTKEFFPDEATCDSLIKGWCINGKFDEAQRLIREMYRGGFEIGVGAYNAMLDCTCKLCCGKGPFRIHSEVKKVLVEMEYHGVPRNVETFMKTEDALRLEEGDEMIDRMRSVGYGEFLDKKAYYQFLKILCGNKRVDHALRMFAMMKADGSKSRGWPVVLKEYVVDPRYLKKKVKVVKGEKKRETLPKKMARREDNFYFGSASRLHAVAPAGCISRPSHWKGYLARKGSKQQLLDLRARMQESARNVDDSKHMATGHSQRCCEELVAAGAVDTLLRLIQTVSRSIPDQEVLKHALSTLGNLARYPQLLELLIHSRGSVQIIVLELLRFCTKKAYMINSPS
ncbi:hypothetical protein RJT34_32090 [Clitoria ternatea]|uniref:Protein unc-45 homolog B n=1 Tax=Clitoria ternatea TaxID=43366 RepID=A0AAN9EXK8_CLITE